MTDDDDHDAHVWAEEEAIDELARSIVREVLVGCEWMPEEKLKDLRALFLAELLCSEARTGRLTRMLRPRTRPGPTE